MCFNWNGCPYKSRHMQWPPPSFYSLTKSSSRISDPLPCSDTAKTPASNISWIVSKYCATQSLFGSFGISQHSLSSLSKMCLPSASHPSHWNCWGWPCFFVGTIPNKVHIDNVMVCLLTFFSLYALFNWQWNHWSLNVFASTVVPL